MKLSYHWLKELTGLDWSAEEMGERLTLCGTACEHIDPADKYMDNVFVGEITAINPIEGADKIKLACPVEQKLDAAHAHETNRPAKTHRRKFGVEPMGVVSGSVGGRV